MAGVTTRSAKGVPLTANDYDGNLEAMISLHKGDTEPSPTYACMLWADTSASLLKMRNEDDDAWITLASLDQTDDTWSIQTKSITLNGTAITATGAELNYVDGVTSAIQTQLDAKIDETSATGSAALPSGTTAQRDGSPQAGYIRFNSEDGGFEGYDGSAWGEIGGGGGATGGGSDQIFYENGQTVTTDYTLTTNTNAGTFGPITIDTGVTVTVPSGSTWTVV